MALTARPEILAMQPYVPGKPAAEVKRELGLTDVVKLASNENPLGASPLALAAARAALAEAHVYPEGLAPELRAALAARWDVPPDWVLVGNGSDEIFRLLTLAYLRPGDRVVVPAPSFSVYTADTQLAGGVPVPVPLRAGAMDLAAMAAAVRAQGARLVFLCRPNNPTGGVFAAGEFPAFLARVPADTLVVLDQAYAEYDATGFDARPFLARHPNLVVTRTFSKVYGLAGLRVGYGVGHPQVWAPLLTIREPFSVNLVGQAAALAALSDQAHLAASLAANAAGKDYLYPLFRELGLLAYPSEANFILVDLQRDAAAVQGALLRHGVIVRGCASFGLPTCIRVTVGTVAQNQRLAAALRAVLT